MLVLAAAVAMPAAAMAGVTAVTGAAVSSAKALPPVAVSCNLGGTVTFAKPGLSYDGSLTNKTVEDTKTDVTLQSGSSAQCSTKAIKEKIVSSTTPCAGASSPAPECSIAPPKTLAKDPNFYDTASSLASSGVSEIVSSLSPGIPSEDNGTKIVLEVTSGGTSEVTPGGACGSTVGFQLTGAVDLAAGGPVVISGSDATYTLVICLQTDTGPGTTGSFFTDYLSAAGGSTVPTIATAGLGSDSNLSIS
ncbi:MAG: hypothetical protein ABSF84_01250 [Acidimicrobiales bacterium]|jgi:hypothetical protein